MAGRAPREGIRPPVPLHGTRSADRRGTAALRPARAVPAAIAAFVLFGIGVLTAVHVITALLGRPVRLVPYEQVVRWARITAWQDPRALALASALALLGLLLLLIAVVPGHGRLVALRTGDPDLVVGVSRRTLARLTRAAAAGVDGVRRARARVVGRRVDVTAITDLRETAELRERVWHVVADELARLAPAHRLTLRVRVRGKS